MTDTTPADHRHKEVGGESPADIGLNELNQATTSAGISALATGAGLLALSVTVFGMMFVVLGKLNSAFVNEPMFDLFG